VSPSDAVAVTVPVSDHYERLLGPIYSWMVGDLEAASVRAEAELDAIGLPAMANGTAVDLGALYWHLVDLVWIYLFPLLYLVGKPE